MTRAKRWWKIFCHKRDKPLRATRHLRPSYMKFATRTRMRKRAAKMRKRKKAMNLEQERLQESAES